MKRLQLLVSAFSILAGLSTAAEAQSQSLPSVWPGYPGSILVAPQQANMLAPALYRTVDPWDALENPVGVVQICERDLQLLQKKNVVAKPAPVAAAGFQNNSVRYVGGKVNVDARVVSVGANADYDQVVTLSTGAVQVIETDDDDISKTMLRGVSAACKQTIAHHLKLRRWVFVAAKAIQAHDYEAVFERVGNASASAHCLLCWGVSAKGEITGKMTDKNRAAAEKTFVTIALVPAEIEDRQFIAAADLQTVAPASDRRLARAARTAESGGPNRTNREWTWAAFAPQPDSSVGRKPSHGGRTRSAMMARAELRQ